MIAEIIDFVLVVAGFILALLKQKSTLYNIGCALVGAAIVFRVFIIYYKTKNRTDVKRLCRQEKYSGNTFIALQKANMRKTQEIMRYTYGKVATWNPINYYKNLLAYDIHEQIRSILMSLRDLIIDMDDSGALNSDNVTVDLLYSYKAFVDNYFACSNEDEPVDEWMVSTTNEVDDYETRIISSGDNDLEEPPSALMADCCSFYKYTSEYCGGYCFVNDKNSLNPCLKNKSVPLGANNEKYHYIVTKKDLRYEPDHEFGKSKHNMSCNIESITNSRTTNSLSRYTAYELKKPGSIVCDFFNLHNDVPSEICVSAVLSIATYGQKLCNDDKAVEAFKADFRNKVLYSYKSLLVSELAQMYIRHSLKKGMRSPVSGAPCKHDQLIDWEQLMVTVENAIKTD